MALCEPFFIDVYCVTFCAFVVFICNRHFVLPFLSRTAAALDRAGRALKYCIAYFPSDFQCFTTKQHTSEQFSTLFFLVILALCAWRSFEFSIFLLLAQTCSYIVYTFFFIRVRSTFLFAVCISCCVLMRFSFCFNSFPERTLPRSMQMLFTFLFWYFFVCHNTN